MATHAKTVTSDFIFYVRSTAHLERRDVLKRLVGCNRSVVAPKLKTYDKTRHTRMIRVHDKSTWDIKKNESFSFFDAAFSAGNITETRQKILAGVNFLTLDSDSKFWTPVKAQPSSKATM